METDVKNRWQIRLAVLAILVIGFLAGALAMNYYHVHGRSSSTESMRGKFDEIFDRLDLTNDQQQQVKAIFDDARTQLAEVRKESMPKFNSVRKQTDERLQSVLTPEQWQQFQQIMNESRERRKGKRGRMLSRP